MAPSLLAQLPDIMAQARREAEALLELAATGRQARLRTRERVDPAALATTRVIAGATSATPISTAAFGSDGIGGWHNRLIEGDNLQAMAALLAGDADTPSLRGSIDLIYVDPPFASQADYHYRLRLGDHGKSNLPATLTPLAYRDRWHDGLAGYLAMLAPRLILMRELLADSGSLFVHLDWHAGHYVKLLLDEIFGARQFRNEIIWHYSGWNKRLRDAFERRHDVLYLYGKRSAPYFASFSEPWPSKAAYLSCRRQKLHVDASGREFVWSDAGGGKRCQRFIDDALREGAAVDDVWHLDKLNHAAGEALGYPTQKPEALLHRLIQSSCPPSGLVADFTAGAGTTAAVAERLGRRWIAVDIGKPACMLTARRLLRQHGAPFVRQRLDEAPPSVCARCDVGTADGCPQALRLLTQCAALTVNHPAQHSAAGYRRGAVLGQAGFDQRTLLWIEPPCVCTGVDTLERAAALRDEAPTRWHRVVVLAWQVGPRLAQAVVTRADPRLAVLMAPLPLPVSPLTRNGRQRGQLPLRFAALRHLSVQPIVRTRDGAHEHLLVRLERFSVLCSGDPDFDEAGPHALRSNDEAASLALLQYWAVDVDYDAGDDGGCFRPCWCAIPSTPGRGGRGLTLSTQVELRVPAIEGPRTVCVRALDCFGHECEAVLRLDGGVRP